MNNFLKTLLMSLSLFVLTITYSKAWVMDVWTIEGMDAQQTMDLASKTAFLTISRYGAGPAMPTREEIDKFFE